MTRCLVCREGEVAGGHDWHTGISYKTTPPHKFKNDNRPDDENPMGFKDKFVMNRHKKERLG